MFKPTSSMYILQEVTRLNHEGVRLLSEKNSPAAYHCFKAALTTIKENLTDLAPEANMDIPSIPVLSFPITGLEDNLFYIHGHALAIDFCSLGVSESTVHLASTAVLFNLALSCHHHGMSRNSTSNLKRACKLYDMCHTLEQEANKTGLASRSPAAANLVSVLAFVAMNNKAQIHYQLLGDQEGAVIILRWLQTNELMVDQSRFLSPCLLEEILLNKYILAGAASLPSAAAA